MRVRRTALCALHALALVLLTLVWMNLSWEFGDEVIVAQVNEIVRFHILRPTDERTEQLKKELLFVNCSYDKVLASFEDEHGAGQRQITDRKKLTELFRILNSSPQRPKLVVVDLLFDDPTRFDTALLTEFKRTSHLILSSDIESDGSFQPRWPELTYAIAQYSTTTDAFLKYNLMEDTLPYLPTAMVHEVEGTRFRPWGGLVRTDPGWWMNSFIVDLPVRNAQLENGEVVVWNLGQALEVYSREEMQEELGNRIVIVGDIFDYDIHKTLLGAMPGPVIVANAYLGLLKGSPRIVFLDVFLIYLLYFFTSLYIVFWRQHREKWMRFSVYKSRVWKFVFKYFTYILIFSLYSVLLYVLTGRHFQLLLFGLYFNLFEFLVDWSQRHEGTKAQRH